MAEDIHTLAVLSDGAPLGTLRRSPGARGGWSLTYSPAATTPVSVSLPLEARAFGIRETERWLHGLLPDNPAVLAGWARRFGESLDHPVDLLRHVGEDVAGAVQFVRPSRLADIVAGVFDRRTWLTAEQVGDRLRVLREEAGGWRLAGDVGQFSLAGAQAKTALYRDPDTGRWALPAGRLPTTHILKPPIARFDGHAGNEHACLRLAARVGLPAADSSVGVFGEETAIVVRRYDRVAWQGRVRRVHQEDLCQAAGVPPSRKYESEGGPKARELAALLRREAGEEAVWAFLDGVAFNWLVGGSDAHAKNYAILLSGRDVTLAPLYDIASILPYDRIKQPRLAMKIGGERRIHCLTASHWRKEATRWALDADAAVARVAALAAASREQLDPLHQECAVEGVEVGPTVAAIRAHLDRVLAGWPRP